MIMRGGTSKGAYFLESDLPAPGIYRDSILLAAMGSPDPRQIDGIGGAHPLTSKVAIVSRSKRPGVDIDFQFAQVSVAEQLVDTTPNCGNILAGVAPFAIERGLVPASEGSTRVTVRTINTGTVAELVVETPGGRVNYEGSAYIDGVPFPAAPIAVNFLDAEGSVCGSLLPTGHASDDCAGVRVTCIDNGMPCVILSAAAMDKSGHESPDELMADQHFRKRLEAIRLEAGRMMGLGDVTTKPIPKMILVSSPTKQGHIGTRSFIPHACHDAIGVFAAVTVATAAVMPGSVANAFARISGGLPELFSVEHPTGELTVRLEFDGRAGKIKRAGLLRTARLLFDGRIFVPESRLTPLTRTEIKDDARMETAHV